MSDVRKSPALWPADVIPVVDAAPRLTPFLPDGPGPYPAAEDPVVGAWTGLCAAWLPAQGFGGG